MQGPTTGVTGVLLADVIDIKPPATAGDLDALRRAFN